MSETKHTPLPCGLCGSPARVSRRSGVTGTACKSRYYREAVVCTGCGVSTKEVKVPGVAVERWNARSASIAALTEENDRLRTERYQLAYAICGGEDAPGYLDSIDVETIAKVCRDNYLLWSKQTDKNIRLEAENERLRKALELIAEAGSMAIISGRPPGEHVDAAKFLDAVSALEGK